MIQDFYSTNFGMPGRQAVQKMNVLRDFI